MEDMYVIMSLLCHHSDKSANPSAKPTNQCSSSESMTTREKRPSVITSVHQSVTTHFSIIGSHARNTNDHHSSVSHNINDDDVIDILDDDVDDGLDAAMRDVDLDIFDDNLDDENQIDYRKVTNESESSPAGMSNMPTSPIKTISDILAIKDKCFHGTVRVKVCT